VQNVEKVGKASPFAPLQFSGNQDHQLRFLVAFPREPAILRQTETQSQPSAETLPHQPIVSTIHKAGHAVNLHNNIPLSGLRPGSVCVVAQVLATGGIAGRLMELGFVPGAVVSVVRRAPFGGPVQYRLHGVSITMRPADAAVVHVQVLADACEISAPARPGHRGRAERMELAGTT